MLLPPTPPPRRELERNLALRVEPGEGAESFRVSGRGMLHLGILIENMRREGYEFEIGPPKARMVEGGGVEEPRGGVGGSSGGALERRGETRRAWLAALSELAAPPRQSCPSSRALSAPPPMNPSAMLPPSAPAPPPPPPQVITREIDGKTCEPYEEAIVEVTAPGGCARKRAIAFACVRACCACGVVACPGPCATRRGPSPPPRSRRRTWAAWWSCLPSARARWSTCSPPWRWGRGAFTRACMLCFACLSVGAASPCNVVGRMAGPRHQGRRGPEPRLAPAAARADVPPCPPPPPHPTPLPPRQATTRVSFKIATRGLLGLKNALLTATRGMGLLNTLFDEYRPVAGEISMRDQGSLVAHETGQARRAGGSGAPGGRRSGWSGPGRLGARCFVAALPRPRGAPGRRDPYLG
jgi:hypothetical protein